MPIVKVLPARWKLVRSLSLQSLAPKSLSERLVVSYLKLYEGVDC